MVDFAGDGFFELSPDCKCKLHWPHFIRISSWKPEMARQIPTKGLSYRAGRVSTGTRSSIIFDIYCFLKIKETRTVYFGHPWLFKMINSLFCQSAILYHISQRYAISKKGLDVLRISLVCLNGCIMINWLSVNLYETSNKLKNLCVWDNLQICKL